MDQQEVRFWRWASLWIAGGRGPRKRGILIKARMDTQLCNRVGCDSPATWQAVLRVRAEEPCDGEANARLQLFVCPACRRNAQIDDILTEECWTSLLGRLREQSFCCDPARSRTKLAFDPLS